MDLTPNSSKHQQALKWNSSEEPKHFCKTQTTIHSENESADRKFTLTSVKVEFRAVTAQKERKYIQVNRIVEL